LIERNGSIHLLIGPQKDTVRFVRLIAAVPVKNEAWILPTSLSALQEIFDVIIVADQQSTDGTREVCSRFSKVKQIRNEALGVRRRR